MAGTIYLSSNKISYLFENRLLLIYPKKKNSRVAFFFKNGPKVVSANFIILFIIFHRSGSKYHNFSAVLKFSTNRGHFYG